MIKVRELKLFGSAYTDLKTNNDLKWWWSQNGKLTALLDNGREVRIDLTKLPEYVSLTELLIDLEDVNLRLYKKINPYEGIEAIGNYESSGSNYYIFSDGTVTEFKYHKYYRNTDIGTMKVGKWNWDGQCYDLKCKKVSKKLLNRLGLSI